jgi:hypothetical protein
MAWQVVLGPSMGLVVKCDSSVMRLTSKHRSSMDSPRLGEGGSSAAGAALAVAPDESGADIFE